MWKEALWGVGKVIAYLAAIAILLCILDLWLQSEREDEFKQIIESEKGLIEPTVIYYHNDDNSHEVIGRVDDYIYGVNIIVKYRSQGIFHRDYSLAAKRVNCSRIPDINQTDANPIQISRTVTFDHKELPAITRQIDIKKRQIIYSIYNSAAIQIVDLDCIKQEAS